MEEFDTKKNEEDKPIKTLRDLLGVLSSEAYSNREDMAEGDQSPEEVFLAPYLTARIIKDIVPCYKIGFNGEDDPVGLYDFEKGIYRFDDDYFIKLAKKVEPKLEKKDISEVNFELRNYLFGSIRTPNNDPNISLFSNGIYHRDSKELTDFTPDIIATTTIATPYIKNATEPYFTDWRFSDWLDELANGDPDRLTLIWQMFASAIQPNLVKSASVFLYDDEIGQTGKGTFQELLINLVGFNNIASLRINEFSDRFRLFNIHGKSLVIGDDNDPKDFIKASANFKSVITGDLVTLERKYKDPISTRANVLVVQSMNGIPQFNDTTGGITRRIRALKFTNAYKGSKNNPRVKREYIKDPRLLEYIAYHATEIESFKELVITNDTREVTTKIQEDDPILLYLAERFPEFESTRLPAKFLFEDFRAWCYDQNAPTRMKQNTFTGRMKNLLQVRDWEYGTMKMTPDTFLSDDIQRYTDLHLEAFEHNKQPYDFRNDSNAPQKGYQVTKGYS